MLHPWTEEGYSFYVLLLLSSSPLVLWHVKKLLRLPIPLLLDSCRQTRRLKEQ